MQTRLASAVLIVCALISVATPARAAELTISAAISLKEVVEELGRRFADAHRGTTLRYNFGASGALAKQIEAGAPVDLFAPAAEQQMDELAAKQLIVTDTRRVFARNRLTVVVPTQSGARLAQPRDLLEPRVARIAIGNPKTVPAGQYAGESLRALALWAPLAKKLVFGENVRQVLDYVARGEVDAGFVYVTDVVSARTARIEEAFRPPESSYSPITYPVAVVRESRQQALARAFVDALTSADARALLVARQFSLPAAR
jgi:molybdate transport system substrate-binding protein